jgi:hypothetical protein
MHDAEGSNWRQLLGAAGEPLPKLGKDQRAKLQSVIEGPEAEHLEPEQRVRAWIAAKSASHIAAVDPALISRAVPLSELTRNLQALCDFGKVLRAEPLLRAMTLQVNPANARMVLLSLHRLLTNLASVKRKDAQGFAGLVRLEPATAMALLDSANWIAPFALDETKRTESRKKRAKKPQRTGVDLLLDVVFQTVARCECAAVCARALDVVSSVQRKLGASRVDDELDRGEPRWTELMTLPSRLIPRILVKGCLADADLLASRTAVLPRARKLFEDAVRSCLGQPGLELALESRQWAERFLGYTSPSEIRNAPIDAGRDVNLERMGALLLAAWDARDEGPKARQLFDVFSGICRTAFGLSLVGQPGQATSFDEARHMPAEGSVMRGNAVRVLRPGVQWSEGLVVRVIVRALVAAL